MGLIRSPFRVKNRNSVTDVPTSPKEPKSTAFAFKEEAVIVAFRVHTLMCLDDCLHSLQATIPHLTRSSPHCCLQRHGISRLPEAVSDRPDKTKFKTYPIGYFHMRYPAVVCSHTTNGDIGGVETIEGKLNLSVAIERTSKFAFVRLVKTGRASAFAFLMALIEAAPYSIHIVLIDNDIQFAFSGRHADGPTATYMTDIFDVRCRENGIEHRLTKIKHRCTNRKLERMNRII